MDRTSGLFQLLFLLSFASGCSSEAREDTVSAPNLILILADDFGYMDTRAYATRLTGVSPDSMYYETPHLDRMVERGIAFSQAYATQLCSPTRAGILTGILAPRLGFQTAMPLRHTYYNQNLPTPEGYYAHDVLEHRDKIEIPQAWINATSAAALPTGTTHDGGRDVLSLPEALHRHHSAFLGKWHLGGFGARGYQPADHGFHPLAWFDAGGSTYFNWRRPWSDKATAAFPDIPQDEWAIGDPGPDNTGENYLTDDLTARALAYLDERAVAPERPFFLYLSHFAVHAPYQAKEEDVAYFREKSTRGWNGHRDPIYAAMIKSMDESLGKIMAKLEETGLSDNTLLVFMSDNGGIDSKITPRGDGTDNRPLLGGKACLTEGGIRVPLIFYWKNRIEGGRWIDVPVDYTDLYPTLADFGGYAVDSLVNIEALDGRSLRSLLNNNSNTYDKEVRYWHYPFNVKYNSPYDGYALTPHSAIRRGDYKLIFDWHGRLHLHDLAQDPYERKNLAEAEPERTEALFGELMGWLRENVDGRYWPTVNPDYDAAAEVREEGFVKLIE